MSLIYRGTSSDDVHFNVTERRVYNAPAFDVSGIEVPGRSGDILNSQERFKNKAIVYTGFIRSSDFPGDTTWERLSRGLRTIKAWACGDAGKYHDLTDDYDPGFVRRAFVSGETAISEVLDRPDGATITITFMAEPFMYEESDPIELPETGTASGAIASFEGVAAPLQSLVFSIEPSQDLHGYSYPWPDAGNINKLPSPTATSKTNNGITIAVNNGVYSISGTATATAEIIFDLPSDVTYDNTYKCAFLNNAANSGVTVYWRYNYTNGTSYGFGGGTNRVAEYSSSGTFNKVRFVITNGTAIIGTLTTSPVLCLKSVTTPTSFSPYSNICPITGWSQVDAVAAGVNLLDFNGNLLTSMSNGLLPTANSDGSITLAGTTTQTWGYLTPVVQQRIKPGTYTLSRETATAYKLYVNFTYDDGTTKNIEIGANATTSYGVELTKPVVSWRLCRANMTNNTAYNENIKTMLSLGSTAWEKYKGTPITISLGQTVYGGYQSAIAGKLIIDRAKYTYGATPTSGNPVATSAGVRASIPCPDDDINKGKWSIQSGKTPIFSKYGGTISKGYGANEYSLFFDGTYTKAEIDAMLADMEIVYYLATPIEVDLTPVSVSSLLGQNNIWCNTGDTEVIYVEPTENPTEWPSKPRLEITMAGAGTLTVNGKTWSIGAYTGTLICDSEIMDWYDASNLKNSLVSGDGFPELQPGENVITYTGGITNVVAKPRWRTL